MNIYDYMNISVSFLFWLFMLIRRENLFCSGAMECFTEIEPSRYSYEIQNLRNINVEIVSLEH